jgi:hypothetical protein
MDEKNKLILPPGTQVVTLIDTRVINEARNYPRGTVGVIKSAPQDATHSYLIEFPDGSFSSLKRREFAIRKQFQTETALDPLVDRSLEKYVIYRCVVGSRAFGLDDESSDTDLRGIYLPPADIQWSMFGLPEQIENRETQECYWELQKFLVLALKANPNILECLNTPLIQYKNEIAEELLTLKYVFLSKLVYQTYNGYVMSQFKKLEQDLRATGSIRWKHAMHLIRLLLQGIDILTTGELIVAIGPQREKLLAIKRGELLWESVNDWRLMLHKEFENAYQTTKLPERPDYDRANRFLLRARREMVDRQ